MSLKELKHFLDAQVQHSSKLGFRGLEFRGLDLAWSWGFGCRIGCLGSRDGWACGKFMVVVWAARMACSNSGSWTRSSFPLQSHARTERGSPAAWLFSPEPVAYSSAKPGIVLLLEYFKHPEVWVEPCGNSGHQKIECFQISFQARN